MTKSAVEEIALPSPVRHRPDLDVDARALQHDLSARVDGEVRFDAGTRGAYSTDASNFRQVPIGVITKSLTTASWRRVVSPGANRSSRPTFARYKRIRLVAGTSGGH